MSSPAPSTSSSTGSAPRSRARASRPVETIAAFARAMGPADGPSEILIDRSRVFAAVRRAGQRRLLPRRRAGRRPQRLGLPSRDGGVPRRARASRRRPAPPGRSSSRRSSPGYEVGIRVGEFLGRSHYKMFHTTGTAGTLAAAAATGRLLRLDAPRCSTPSARPGRRPPDCGSSCAMPPIPSLCTPARPPPTA